MSSDEAAQENTHQKVLMYAASATCCSIVIQHSIISSYYLRRLKRSRPCGRRHRRQCRWKRLRHRYSLRLHRSTLWSKPPDKPDDFDSDQDQASLASGHPSSSTANNIAEAYLPCSEQPFSLSESPLSQPLDTPVKRTFGTKANISPSKPPPGITMADDNSFYKSPSSFLALSPLTPVPESPPLTASDLPDPIAWESPIQATHSTPRRGRSRYFDLPSYDCEWFLSRNQLFEKESVASPTSPYTRGAHRSPLPRPSWKPIPGLSTPERRCFFGHEAAYDRETDRIVTPPTSPSPKRGSFPA